MIIFTIRYILRVKVWLTNMLFSLNMLKFFLSQFMFNFKNYHCCWYSIQKTTLKNSHGSNSCSPSNPTHPPLDGEAGGGSRTRAPPMLHQSRIKLQNISKSAENISDIKKIGLCHCSSVLPLKIVFPPPPNHLLSLFRKFKDDLWRMTRKQLSRMMDFLRFCLYKSLNI